MCPLCRAEGDKTERVFSCKKMPHHPELTQNDPHNTRDIGTLDKNM